jgi:hypothetical protein
MKGVPKAIELRPEKGIPADPEAWPMADEGSTGT